jgi:hypothetical protein
MAQRRTIGVDEKERRELLRERDHDPRPDVRERWAALLKIAAGETAHGVARHGLLKERDPDPVYGWLNAYVVGGLAGRLARRHGGPHRGYL